MAQIRIPTPLRKFTDNQGSIETTAGTIGEAIKNLTDTFPELGLQVLDENGKIKRFIRIYIGDTDIKSLEDEKTVVYNDSVVSIIPAIAGGISF